MLVLADVSGDPVLLTLVVIGIVCGLVYLVRR